MLPFRPESIPVSLSLSFCALMVDLNMYFADVVEESETLTIGTCSFFLVLFLVCFCSVSMAERLRKPTEWTF